MHVIQRLMRGLAVTLAASLSAYFPAENESQEQHANLHELHFPDRRRVFEAGSTKLSYPVTRCSQDRPNEFSAQ
jgi:hypothetical protein